MSEFFQLAVGTGIGAVVGGIVVGIVDALLFTRLRQLPDQLRQLEEHRVATLERRVAELGKDGCGVGNKVLERIDAMRGQLSKVDLKLDRIAEETASQKAELGSNRAFLDNLNTAHREHVADRIAHGGHRG